LFLFYFSFSSFYDSLFFLIFTIGAEDRGVPSNFASHHDHSAAPLGLGDPVRRDGFHDL
jgi:hypothetical protein